MKDVPHILYIEDNDFNQRLIKKILTPAGFRISKALDGIQGIRMAIDLEPDLILMDLDLPFLDGLGVAAKIKSVQGMDRVPIVALTSKSSKRDRDRALVAGCDGYILKPINADLFPDQLRTYLEGKREVTDATEPTELLKDIQITFLDQLQAKVEQLEEMNQELTNSKEQLQQAYRQSQEWNQELHRLTKLKENIVSITSHELRTPLSIATGYNDLLLEGLMGELNPEQRHAMEINRQNLGKMRELVDKITDLTRLALKKFPLELEELDLATVFLDVFEDYSFFMKIRKIDLENRLSSERTTVLADRNLIHQVFGNLLKNAICFTPDGGKITVSSWIESNKAFFEIEDNGIGIPEEDLERIFDEFYQVQDVDHHKTGHFEFMTRGIGVGLALCKGILSELGGKITARSSGFNKGSTFMFYLPTVKRE